MAGGVMASNEDTKLDGNSEKSDEVFEVTGEVSSARDDVDTTQCNGEVLTAENNEDKETDFCPEDDRQNAQFTEAEYVEQNKRLHEVEAKLQEYERSFNAVSEQVQHEFAEMQNEIHLERQKSAKAVNIASKVYRQNTILRKSRRFSSRSDTRRKWAREGSVENGLMVPAVVVYENQSLEPSSPGPTSISQDDLDDDIVDKELEQLQKDTSRKDLPTENDELRRRLVHAENENKSLKERVEHYKKLEASATNELIAIKDRLEVESQVRKKAETFAAQMYGENRSWERQSMMRKKKKDSSGEDSKLQEALEENKALSEELEKLKMEHRQLIEEMEQTQGASSTDDKTHLLNLKIRQLTDKNEEVEERCRELEHKLAQQSNGTSEVVSESKVSIPPPPPPPPPPPLSSIPPPPPPSGSVASKPARDPLQDLKALVNERKNERMKKAGMSPMTSPASPTRSQGSSPASYADAMAEMMNRIKLGNVALKSPKRRMTDMSESGESTPSTDLESPAADDTQQPDIFDKFRIGLKPANERNQNRRVSEPAAPSKFFFPKLQKVGLSMDQNNDEEKPTNKFATLKPPKVASKFDRAKSGSVKHPKEVSSELKAILDRKRNQSKQTVNKEDT